MYLKEYFPFYTTYANPLLYEGERMQDKEFNLMKSYYPGTVQHIQEILLSGYSQKDSGEGGSTVSASGL